MNKLRVILIYTSGISVYISLAIVMYAIAYLNRGHPPGSGIVALFVFLFASPIWLLGGICGFWQLLLKAGKESPWLWIAHGSTCVAIAIVLLIFLFKVVLGKTI